MIVMKPASNLAAGDMFSTDGYIVTSAASLLDGRVSVEIALHGHVKRALLDPEFECPIFISDTDEAS